MFKIHNITSADEARRYYLAAKGTLVRGDYYTKGQAKDFLGEWRGDAAARLGLEGKPVDPEVFDRLLRNQDPLTGKSLTGSTHPNRRPGVDFTFSPPKSFSALYAFTGDERLVEALRESVRQTMQSLEAEMMCRVREKGQNRDRKTGNLAYAEIVHFTTRPVREESPDGDAADADERAPEPAGENTPDMQLHIHAVAPNLTWDAEEEKWKALQLEEFGKGKEWSERPRLQAEFYSHLAEHCRHLGYQVRRTGDAFEIAGLPERVIGEFSRRSREIDTLADELGVTSAEGRDVLARTSRERKDPSLSWQELTDHWRQRLKPGELAAIESLYRNSLEPASAPHFDAKAAVDYGLNHLLAQKSVVPEKDVLITAMKFGLGTATSDGIKEELARRDLLRAEIGDIRMVTTREVLGEELTVLDFAKERRGLLSPLNPDGATADERLSVEQRQAVQHVWHSRDPITLIRGKAGTGKTTMMKEAVRGIEAGGHRVAVLAPTADAAYGVLKDKEGFENATTVANFLDKRELQERARGQVIWCDEAGLLGFQDMARLVRLAKELDARIVLSGDRGQHRAVARGEPLALLEDLAGLPVAELREIRRQLSSDYRAAVKQLADCKVAGFDALDAMGAVTLMPVWGKYEPLVEDYVAASKENKSVVVLSPTRKEGQLISEALRTRLKEEKLLSTQERELKQLSPLFLTEAQRSDPQAIAGKTVIFVKHAGKHRAGERLQVTPEIAEQIAKTPLAFAAYQEDTIRLAAGDKIRITANGRDKTGKHRVNNGSVYQIKKISEQGDVTLSNGWVLPSDFGTWMQGYALTSYAAQGKTTDRVLVAISTQSYPAVNARQMYVDASRGRERIALYIDDRRGLRDAIARDHKQLHAVDLAGTLLPKPKPKPQWKQRLRRQIERFRRWQPYLQSTDRKPLPEPIQTHAMHR